MSKIIRNVKDIFQLVGEVKLDNIKDTTSLTEKMFSLEKEFGKKLKNIGCEIRRALSPSVFGTYKLDVGKFVNNYSINREKVVSQYCHNLNDFLPNTNLLLAHTPLTSVIQLLPSIKLLNQFDSSFNLMQLTVSHRDWDRFGRIDIEIFPLLEANFSLLMFHTRASSPSDALNIIDEYSAEVLKRTDQIVKAIRLTPFL